MTSSASNHSWPAPLAVCLGCGGLEQGEATESLDCAPGACARARPVDPLRCASTCLSDGACGDHGTCLPNLAAPAWAISRGACFPRAGPTEVARSVRGPAIAGVTALACGAALLLRRAARRRESPGRFPLSERSS